MLHKKNRLLILIMIAVLVGSSILAWLFNKEKAWEESALDGMLDISQWDGESVLSLSGEWDFFWNRFLDENDLSSNPEPDLKTNFPSVWNGSVVNGNELDGMGFATYRLHVTGAKGSTSYGMRILPFLSAYSLYIDNELVASSGSVSTSNDGFVPRYRVQTVTFTPEKDEFDIILHISNFTYARGGACYTIYFGNSEKISRMSNLIFGMDFFIVSCLLLISAYTMFLFFLRHDKGDVLLLLLCIAFIGRTIISGNYLINYLLPRVRFIEIIWIDYTTLYILPGLLLWLARYIYLRSVPRWLIRLLFIYAAGMTVFTLLLPVRIFTEFIYAAEAIAIGSGIYCIVTMIMLIIRRKSDVHLILAGGFVLTICIFHDVLFENNLIRAGYTEWSPVGFLMLTILIQGMFWIRYDRSVRENERILIEMNRADERERKLELQFLKSQIRPHFINNALNAIISISRTDSEKSIKLLIEFSRYLQSCYRVQNLEDKVPIENELSFVRSYVMLEQARYPDALCVEYDIDSIFLMIPPLTLQPLVENAIIHGVRGKSGVGHVLVYVKDFIDYVKVGVMDDGVGFDPTIMQTLLSEEARCTGVGIYNINRRIKRFYNTGLYLENRSEGGANAYIIIPKEEEACCELY